MTTLDRELLTVCVFVLAGFTVLGIFEDEPWLAFYSALLGSVLTHGLVRRHDSDPP